MLSFGEDCRYLCNVNCFNQTCDRINGSCLYGCGGNKCDTGTYILLCNPATIFITIAAFYHYKIHSILNKSSNKIFTVYLLDSVKHTSVSSKNLPITIGGLVCACVLIIIGVVITICVIR